MVLIVVHSGRSTGEPLSQLSPPFLETWTVLSSEPNQSSPSSSGDSARPVPG